jgi:Zn-dependent peptidase ImmA (M78 family)
MARQCGEQKAKEYGFTSFPVDPFLIAEREEILVEPKPAAAKGVSGGIIFNDEDVAIFYATDITSHGFQRFTVSHELGHYFLDGHPQEILKSSPMHLSRAGFSQGNSSIEIEADHFASGLLMPTPLTRAVLDRAKIGLAGIEELAEQSECSLTAAAIRAAECAFYPIAVMISEGTSVCYCFMSDSFKALGAARFWRRGSDLPDSVTRNFNSKPASVASGMRTCGQTTLSHWFDGSSAIILDEEVVGLGSYGHTLTVFSSEDLDDEDDEGDEEEILIESWTPQFSYKR